ncbi:MULTISPECIES: ABC transporter substrate-binding protein [Novosphingobium]|uniref:ABC transporter substrate-binding protein n=1 Tax=Novosphingobium TaxID=165696 RepID=UPI0022F26EF7|nr:ABC transporter substrate-binding protein [Novosphingobium resinovorum]GLK44900.1 monooxygenase [Novosphingobium resinovorum]
MTDNIHTIGEATAAGRLDRILFTRCPVPTASGIAHSLGWLGEEFGRDGLRVEALQDKPRAMRAHHNEHDLPGLFREGGNIPALATKAKGAPTRVIGLTWIDEWQAVLVRPETGPIAPAQLGGLRVALPAWRETRGSSIARGMSLAGIKGALGIAGLTLEDVTFVDVALAPASEDSAFNLDNMWSGIEALAAGTVDAVYVKGASAVDAAKRAGVVVGIDLDGYPSRHTRVNNGTPRPITVSQDLLDDHFDLVVRFLEQTLRAADWAVHNLPAVRAILQTETHAGAAGVEAAYRNNFHRSLHPDLSDERIALLRRQANFLWLHGFLEHDVDVDAWIDPRPLAAAIERRAQNRAA